MILTLKSTNFAFESLKLLSGIYLIDLNMESNYLDCKPVSTDNNFSLLIIPDKLPKVSFESGMTKTEIFPDMSLLYMFIKTHKTLSFKDIYNVDIKFCNRQPFIHSYRLEERDLGLLFVNSYYKFTWGADRQDIMEIESFNNIKNSLKYITKYESLIEAQHYPKIKTPLGRASNNFVAAFANEMWDEPKLILSTSCLEALFLTDSKEMTFRLAHNIAWFLYPKLNQYKERIGTIKKVRKLYDYRSSFVHGSYKEVPNEIWDYSFYLISNIFTHILEKYNCKEIFLDIEKHKKFIEHLESGKLLLS